MSGFDFKKKTSPVKLFGMLLFLAIVIVVGIMYIGGSQELRQKAALAGTVLSMNPATKTAAVGTAFNIGIILAANTYSVTGAELHISYDPAVIQVTGFVPGTPLPVVLSPVSYGNGAFTVTLGAQPQKYLIGSNVIGNLKVKVLKNTPTSISFASGNIVTAIQQNTNTLAAAKGTTVNGPVTPTPTVACLQAYQLCGGIAGRTCPSGTQCVYSNGSRTAPFPDASGTCQGSIPLCPTPTPVSCNGAANGASCTIPCPTFTPCPSGAYCALDAQGGTLQNDAMMIRCAPRPGVCTNGRCIPVTPTPTPTCVPRPACLDANPPCSIPIPVGTIYCPTPTCIPVPNCVHPLPGMPVCDLNPNINYCPLSPLFTTAVTGQQSIVTPGQAQLIRTNVKEFDGTAGTPAEGFNVQVYVNKLPQASNPGTVFGGNATFDGVNWTITVPGSASSQVGDYKLSVSAYCANDSSICAKRYGIGRQVDWTFNYKVEAISSCTRNAPTVSINPTSKSGHPGDSLTYDVTITNTDSPPVYCPMAQFTTTITVPSGWTATQILPFSTVPGTNTEQIKITSPVTASSFTGHPFTVTTKNNTSGKTGSATGTYILTQNQQQSIDFLVKLSGVTDDRATGAKVGVKFLKADGTIQQLSAPLSLSYVGNGVYKASAALTNSLPAGTQFRVQIKGEKHAAIVFSHNAGQTNQCPDTSYITMPNPVPTSISYDFTGVPLPGGDTTPQDGQVDQTDIGRVIALMGKASASLNDTDRLVADFNYDGVINVNDLFQIYKTLQTRCD